MSEATPSQRSGVAGTLFSLVCSLLVLPLVLTVVQVVAQSTGGSQPPQVLVSIDPLSDAVSATAADFRVDESGAATYRVPLFAVPGTAGMQPRLSLAYSSQGGYGILGKGWSIGGTSSITRCRATREAGDFLGSATPDGDPRAVNFSASDRFCLDGQRLLPSSMTCPSIGGFSGVALGTEIDTFNRVCAYTANAALGPAFFTVEGKDGSTSWYGDRDSGGGANRPDGYVETTSPIRPGAALYWAQTRLQDSTGNYVDYVYSENPAGAGTGEHVLKEVRYTGKLVLSGQAGSAQAPYAKLQFNYSTRPAAEWSRSYVAGGVITGSQRLDSITACASATAGCATENQARHVLLTYEGSTSGSGWETLIGLQECRDSTAAVCSGATSFLWGNGAHQFASYEKPANLSTSTVSFRNFKFGDINGDGRADLVYLSESSPSPVSQCATDYIVASLSTLDTSGRPTFAPGTWHCSPGDIIDWQTLDYDRGEGAWNLIDYNGDGRDDLFISGPAGQGWRLFPSNGAGFDMNQNLIAGLSGIIPSSNYADYQVTLADLNGDGLTDIVYSNGGLRARLMERQGTAFGWGGERAVQFDQASLDATYACAPGDTCTSTAASLPSTLAGFTQLADFNGDASSDLLVRVTTRIRFAEPICDPLDANTTYENVVADNAAMAAALAPAAPPCVTGGTSYNIGAFGVLGITPATITLGAYGTVAPGLATALQLADFNGDGLTDTAYRNNNSSPWFYRLNTGNGLQYGVEVAVPGGFEAQAKFADANGDGRADMLYLIDNGNKVYYWRKALPAGGFATGAQLVGGNARHCEGNCNVNQSVSWFADMDGDGNQDFMSMGLGHSTPSLYVSRANQRFVPRDVITRVVNGMGLETQLTYASLTNAAVYRRDTGSRNSQNWGRGSAVMDMLTSSYVVARAASTSPIPGNPAALATVHYRYAGARIQGGGRGFLGFREIVSVDTNQTGGYVATTTSYGQNFPFIGVPMRTVKAAVIGQAYATPACLDGSIDNSCFAVPGQAFSGLGGSWFSDHVQSWEVAPASLSSQVPLHVRTAGTDESLRDPYAGTQTSKVSTAFSYVTYGNVSQTIVDTYTGTSTLVSTLITSNTYSDNVARWRLGRLTGSTVTHRRPGQSDIVRTTGFGYAMTGPVTGLLTEETTQPGGAADLASTKAYLLDAYGNRTQATTCAAPTATCNPSGLVFQPASTTTVKRYSRTVYDAQGRYPVSVHEPFWTPSGAQERTVMQVVDRTILGDPINTLDVNNVRTFTFKGQFGRDYFTWIKTDPNASPGSGGVTSSTTYRWCGTGTGQVACPTGAKFRQQVVATAQPRQWTYYDAMARPMLKAVESFNVGVSGKDVSAVCTEHDRVGRPTRVSNPFFLAGTATTDGPPGVATACTTSRLWTTTSYDILGRTTSVLAPDGSSVGSSYAGLATIVTDPRGNATRTTRNGKGEVTQVLDAAGLATTFTYRADGNLASVSRDAGRGAVVNSFTYDVLGRKVIQNDPDSGIIQFSYNALGEAIAQVDASGQRVENEYDARGRVWRKTYKTPAGSVESQAVTIYDTAANGLGQIASESITGTYAAWSGQSVLAHSYSRAIGYDTLGRTISASTAIGGVSYPQALVYDLQGRPWKSQDASGRWVRTEYNARGAAAAVCNSSSIDASVTCAADANTYLRNLESDPWGNMIRERRGNSAAMDVTRQHHPQTGRISSICAGSTSCNLVNEAYAWDAAGNLSTRQKEQRYLEGFTYDSLNRLTQGKLLMRNGVTANDVTQIWTYDKLGNICQRTEFGITVAWNYTGRAGCGTGGLPGTGGSGGLSVHQLASVGVTYYGHDAMGNQTSRTRVDTPGTAADRFVRYNAGNQAYEIALGNQAAPLQQTRFWYAPDGSRYKQEEGGVQTLYLGNVEVVIQGASTTFKRYVAGTMLQTISGSTVTTKYLFHDQLGSLVRITAADGTVASSLDYAAFGQRRSYADPLVRGAPTPNETSRGFTGHEHVEGTQDSHVIHMNGRIFDASAGRFMQPDPIIQEPNNAQSWNPYAYVFNNPLANTDPTGMFSARQFLGFFVAVVMTIVAPQTAGFWYAMATGFASGYVATGTFKGGVIGAFSAGVSYGIVSAGGLDPWQRTGLQATTGGIVERLSGGSFGHGFVSAGLTASVMPQVGKVSNDIARTAMGALVGGTLSAATGGKFANGAVSGAIQGAMAKNVAESDSSTMQQAASPGGADWGYESGTLFYENVKVSHDIFTRTWVVTGDFTVSGANSVVAAQQLNDSYNFIRTNGEETISIAFNFKRVSSNGDLRIEWFNAADYASFAQAGIGTVAGRMEWMSRTMELNKNYWNYKPNVIPHEFGHGLGLRHAPNWTGSMMGYGHTRSWQWQDAVNIKNVFRCNRSLLKSC